MCGFFGLVDFSDNITPRDHEEIKYGAEKVKYRGPDTSAFINNSKISVAFQRLSIIDLSAFSQPYTNENDTIIMVCNGEIYNYKDLRSKLIAKNHVFKTMTDSEVVLHGYEEWGTECWRKLNGIFSIVIWDMLKQHLYIVRDYFGVKPLHFMVSGPRVYFSTDYNSFLCQSHTKIEYNPQAILSYLTFRHAIGEQTFYKNINDVLPGYYITITSDSLKNRCYWDFPLDEDDDKGLEHYENKLEEKLSCAVDRQLMSDVPLGAFISGGLDSSIILHYMRQNRISIKSFATGFTVDDYNEFDYVELIAKSIGIKPRILILEMDEYLENIEEVVSYRGEPVSVPHEAAFLKMSQFMKKDITVVLSGEGADELFAGYGRIFRSPMDFYKQQWFTKHPILRRLCSCFIDLPFNETHSTPMEHFLWRYAWFTNKDKQNLLNMDFFNNSYIDDYSISYVDGLFKKTNNLNYYKQIYYILGKIHLVNLLNRLDRMTMAASVEARVPFLDIDLVEFVSRIPIHYKLRWNGLYSRISSLLKNSEQVSEKYDTPKFILKKLAEGKIPDEIIKRKKMGFPVPLDEWFSHKSILKNSAKELLLARDSRTRDILNIKNLEKFLSKDNYKSDYDYDGKKIWMLLNLEIWMRKYFV